MQEFKLPDLGEGMEEAAVRRWLVQAGDQIKAYQPLVEVESVKALMEIPSPVAGRVAEIRVPEGQVAKKGEVLVTFETATTNGKTRPTPAASAPVSKPVPNVPAPTAPVSEPARRRVLAAPAVRKLAFGLKVELEQVTPSNADGRVSLDDVRAFAANAPLAQATPVKPAPQAAPTLAPTEQDERVPLTGLRKRIAERMEHAWRTIPHATSFDEVDAGALMDLRQTLLPVAEQRELHLTFLPLLIKLLLPVLKEFPIFNASLSEEPREIIYHHAYHIGIAAASPEGLLVPVLRTADKLSLARLAAEVDRLSAGARQRSLPLSELTGSTFTLNNVGSFGGRSGTPIINYPEVAILAFGRIQEQAVVRQGALLARPIMPLALSYDHRLIDGALAGAFLARLKALIENPQQLMLDMQ